MSQYSDLLISQNVAYYWPLDETSGTTAFAAVGGVNMETTGYVDKGVLAAVNTGFAFTGGSSSSLIAASNSSMTFNPSVGLSYSLIIKANSTMVGAGAWGIISRRANSSSGRTFGAFMQGSAGGSINIDLGNNQVRWDTGFIPTQDHFFHIAFVWVPAGGEYRFYVNGELYSSATGLSPTIQSGNAPFYLGALGANPVSQLFPGVIDEVAVWNNKSLSDEEIRAQYRIAFPIMRVFDGSQWNPAEKRVL